ncbi:MAG TPA: serine hydrolase, partial [Chryseolinea sp.]|nr:serine hydrolase [Chryseolinea sp.]
MKKILLLILLPATLIQSTHSQEMITEKLDSAVAVYASLNAFNGSVLVARHGKVLLQKGYGYKNVQDKSVNDANTIFQVGSITKEFT